MNAIEMLKQHKEEFPDCPATRSACKHWKKFNYHATFNGFPQAFGNVEAFNEQQAKDIARAGLSRDVPFELLTLEIIK